MLVQVSSYILVPLIRCFRQFALCHETVAYLRTTLVVSLVEAWLEIQPPIPAPCYFTACLLSLTRKHFERLLKTLSSKRWFGFNTERSSRIIVSYRP